MDVLTVYLPIELDSTPYCPAVCAGNYQHKALCTVFWYDLKKAVGANGKALRNNTGGYVYEKCEDCRMAVKQASLPPPDRRVTIPTKWRQPPDSFYTE